MPPQGSVHQSQGQTMELISQTLTESYVKVLAQLQDAPARQSSSANPTARDQTRTLHNVTTIIQQPRTRAILAPGRQHSKDYLVNEFAWYLSGRYDVEGIERIQDIWEQYTDGKGRVASNYGAKLFHEPVDDDGTTQWEYVTRLFRKDPSTRRAILAFNLFNTDYRNMVDGKDFPCAVSAQLLKRRNALDIHVFQRSCDIVYGYGNDIPIFSLFLEMFATELGLELGRIVHHTGSMHIYEKHSDRLDDAGEAGYVDEQEETFLPAMNQEDVDALLTQEYSGTTPFMEALRDYLDDYWL